MNNVAKGGKGEDIAVDFLRENGFEIIHRNWRAHRYEIDIIATKNDVIHFIEVKLRAVANGIKVEQFLARNAVSHKKMQHLFEGVQFYVDLYQIQAKVSLDLIAIDMYNDSRFQVTHYPNFTYL